MESHFRLHFSGHTRDHSRWSRISGYFLQRAAKIVPKERKTCYTCFCVTEETRNQRYGTRDKQLRIAEAVRRRKEKQKQQEEDDAAQADEDERESLRRTEEYEDVTASEAEE